MIKKPESNVAAAIQNSTKLYNNLPNDERKELTKFGKFVQNISNREYTVQKNIMVEHPFDKRS